MIKAPRNFSLKPCPSGILPLICGQVVQRRTRSTSFLLQSIFRETLVGRLEEPCPGERSFSLVIPSPGRSGPGSEKPAGFQMSIPQDELKEQSEGFFDLTGLVID